MAVRGRFSAAPSGGPVEASAADGAVEEANPFSFKEFVRSQNQREAVVHSSEGRSHKANPKESARCPAVLDGASLSPESLGLRLECQECFFSHPTAAGSLLEEEEEGWSGLYQPSAVEEAHLARVSSISLSSTFDSFYCDPSDLPTPSSWQLGGSDGYQDGPLEGGDQSSSLDEETAEDGFYPPLQATYEELKEDNSKFKNRISYLQAACEAQAKRVKELKRTLEDHKLKEAKEARDLEAMVQQVEENLRLMTKRAMKAENSVMKLKQENAQLQVQMKNCQVENEALKSNHSANLAVMKQNADVALQNLLSVITKSHSSIKQLLSGAEALQLVADLLKSIDRISEIPEGSP
ncbi:endosome-associated-trafficking regulator 1 isoform X2 [Sphaerodactylus townsendi]|uniref:endosome-associated-trafficking regulator 1 isoform X2 n=1 Tax=Sphaerodactylus townsendi TaxID=933632 RepID=UPI00202674B8|nr:endosome-associated-trafficking regulator 1 isoform X2 [Sphaerodactylus townsendi]